MNFHPFLTLIFQSSMYQGLLPEEQKVANIIPIFKKGSCTQTCNYCPVSLTPSYTYVEKFLNMLIVYSCIFFHLTKYSILHEEQHGFQAVKFNYQLYVHDFANYLSENSQTDCIFLDYSKAFDRVLHARLCNKLSHFIMDQALSIQQKPESNSRWYQQQLFHCDIWCTPRNCLSLPSFLCFVSDIRIYP